ncbi:lipopolysaccharide-induced tumor necrosis factor-alpha factor homolog [Drosophila montana]|uniref:lipopolysaccharide-induced tumor necrosis factor-alpha factor homolog n=1 Tax=Drosophila montana TaxID=40370 RepID=UPI00313D9D6A
MEYTKLPPQPPPYSPEQPDMRAAPSAPPTEMIHTAPMYNPPVTVVNQAPPITILNQTSTVLIDNNSGNGMICPHCHARIRMRVEHHATCTTYMWSAILCLFLCWPCVCLPCCCDCGYRTSQYCPNCKACLGRF